MQHKSFLPLELQLGMELGIYSADRVAEKVRDGILKDTTGKMKNFLCSFGELKYYPPVQVILYVNHNVQKHLLL